LRHAALGCLRRLLRVPGAHTAGLVTGQWGFGGWQARCASLDASRADGVAWWRRGAMCMSSRRVKSSFQSPNLRASVTFDHSSRPRPTAAAFGVRKTLGRETQRTPQSPGGAPHRGNTMRVTRTDVHGVDNRRAVFDGQKARRSKVVSCVSCGVTPPRRVLDFPDRPIALPDVETSGQHRLGYETRGT